MKTAQRAPASVGDLAVRLVALLLFAGAAMFGVVAAVITHFESRIVGGEARYVLPGSNATLGTAVLPALMGCASLLAVAGVLCLLFGPPKRILTTTVGSLAEIVPARETPRWRRSVVILLVGVLVLAAVLGLRWARSSDGLFAHFGIASRP